MTTAPPRPSPSPRWDGLNEGFVSPARLQQWKQEHERVHTLGSPLGTPQQDPSANRPTPERRNTSTDSYSNGTGSPPSKPTHRARPSFASFFSRKSAAMDDPPLVSSPPQSQGPLQAGAPMQQQQQPPGPPSSYTPPRPAHLRKPSASNPSHFMQQQQQQQPPPPQQQPPAQQPPPMQGPLPPSQAPPPTQGPGGADVAPQGGALHPEIKSVVQLTLAHSHKVYFSGPLVRRIERQPDGQKPAKDEGWREVWAQLGGTTLSVWDMEEIREASKQGRQVPPTYINVTDAFVHVLGSIALPPTPGAPQRRYTNVLTVNTAGSNLYLFSCPSPEALVQWTAAMRLAAWEKSRLEEIYTAHLIRITLNDGRGTPGTLVNGRLEGWVRVRIAGQTDWKRMWMVISAGSNTGGHPDRASIASQGNERPESPNAPRRRRMSNLFSREKSPASNLPARPLIQAFTSPKPRDKRKALLTMHTVSQAFAVYPERPELISRSTLMKVEGHLGEEEIAGILKGREAWLLVMPELEGANTRASEMLRWLIAIHDAFELYGRPKMYSWDPRDAQSMMFAYPIGPHREMLFLDREFGETLDPRVDRTSAIRTQLQRILLDRMNSINPSQGARLVPPAAGQGPPTLPPLPNVGLGDNRGQQSPQSAPPTQPPPGSGPLSHQLPPLSFDADLMNANLRVGEDRRALSPITEHSTPLEGRTISRQQSSASVPGEKPLPIVAGPPPRTIPEEPVSILQQPLATSPVASSPPPDLTMERKSVDSYGQKSPNSRPDSKLTRGPSEIAYAHSRSSSSNPSSPAFPPESVRQATSPEPRPTTPSTPPRFAVAAPHVFSPPRTASPLRAMSPARSEMLPMSDYPYTPSSARIVPDRSISQTSIPTSLHTIATPTVPPVPGPRPLHSPISSSPPPTTVHEKKPSLSDDILGDAGAALFYMQHMHQQESCVTPISRRGPPLPVLPSADDDEDEDEDEDSESESEPYTPPPRIAATSPLRAQKSPPPSASPQPPAVPAKTPPPAPPAAERSSVRVGDASAASRPSGPLRNKPSGARAAPATRMSALLQNTSVQPLSPTPSTTTTTSTTSAADDKNKMVVVHPENYEDPNADALAALSFLEQEDRPAPPAVPRTPPAAASGATSPPLPEVIETPASPSYSRSQLAEVPRSSFAPTRLATERKAKSQAQQAAQLAAAQRPGKSNGRNRARPKDAGAWGDSSDEDDEEEDEEEDDEDVDSDAEPPLRAGASVSDHAPASSASSARVPYGQSGVPSPARSMHEGNSSPFPSPRQPRNLPQVPGGQEEYLGAQPTPRRFVSDNYNDPGRRGLYPGDGSSRGASPQFGQPTSMRPPSQMPPQFQPQMQAPGARPIWSQVLDPDRNIEPSNGGRETFIQMEAPATTMTKAFTPHGLLSAGMQDKQDRSAKKQEELARETGASLINVPLKPPPPQTGLLGAVTAHERERKREGGLGAALTEREREKRMAEERQRKLDEFQKQQLEQMQQGGMYGVGQGMMGGLNPMMANPMMMGMNPMMTGGWGYPGMMPGFNANTQQLFAAQQAAQQAYQQAMYAFSTAGSHIGGNDTGPAQQPMNPMMTGNTMGMGFDPRMSMMNMGMMGMNPMGMTPTGMGGGMGGMGGGMGGMGFDPRMSMMGGGMGMQMTGASQFDPRMSPGLDSQGQAQAQAKQQSLTAPASPAPSGAAGSGPRPAPNEVSGQTPNGGPSAAAQ